jgi:hypothetical protein
MPLRSNGKYPGAKVNRVAPARNVRAAKPASVRMATARRATNLGGGLVPARADGVKASRAV